MYTTNQSCAYLNWHRNDIQQQRVCGACQSRVRASCFVTQSPPLILLRAPGSMAQLRRTRPMRARPLAPSPDSFLSRNPPAYRDPKLAKHLPQWQSRDTRPIAPVPQPISVARNLTSVGLYRTLSRTISAFPIDRLRHKLRFNAREAFQLNRMERDPTRLARLHVDANTVVRFLRAVSSMDRSALELLFSRALDTDGQFHKPPPYAVPQEVVLNRQQKAAEQQQQQQRRKLQ